MIKIILGLSLFFALSFGATLLNQNIYERDNRIDLMLSFDSVYEGKISRAQIEDTIVVTLWDATAETSFANELNHPLMQKIEILRSEPNQMSIYFFPNSKVDIIAARTADGYGLRLRIVEKEATSQTAPQDDRGLLFVQNESEQTPKLAIQTKENFELSTGYIATVSALFLLAIVLFVLKKKISSSKDSWLLPAAFKGKKPHTINVKFQKALDVKNRVVLLEYEGREYLTLIGNSNILLDTFEEGNVVNDDGFEKIFRQNQEKLNEYLKIGHNELEDENGTDSFRKNAERVE